MQSNVYNCLVIPHKLLVVIFCVSRSLCLIRTPLLKQVIENQMQEKKGNFLEKGQTSCICCVFMYCKIKWNQVIVVCDHSISINFVFFIVVLGAVEL